MQILIKIILNWWIQSNSEEGAGVTEQ